MWRELFRPFTGRRGTRTRLEAWKNKVQVTLSALVAPVIGLCSGRSFTQEKALLSRSSRTFRHHSGEVSSSSSSSQPDSSLWPLLAYQLHLSLIWSDCSGSWCYFTAVGTSICHHTLELRSLHLRSNSCKLVAGNVAGLNLGQIFCREIKNALDLFQL